MDKKTVSAVALLVIIALSFAVAVVFLGYDIHSKGQSAAQLQRKLHDIDVQDHNWTVADYDQRISDIVQVRDKERRRLDDLNALVEYQEQIIDGLEQQIDDYNQTVYDQDRAINDLGQRINDNSRRLQRSNQTLNELLLRINHDSQTIQNHSRTIERQNQTLHDDNQVLDTYNRTMLDSVQQALRLNHTLTDYAMQRDTLNNQLRARNQTILYANRTVEDNLRAIEQQKRTMADFVQQIAKKRGQGVCYKPECVLASAALIQAMDTTADPCDDFFQFACGGFLLQNPIPDGKAALTRLDVLQDEVDAIIRGLLEDQWGPDDPKPIRVARQMYSTCMNQGLDLEAIDDPNYKLTRWPLINANWTESWFDWSTFVVVLHLNYDLPVLMEVKVQFPENVRPGDYIHIDIGPALTAEDRGIINSTNHATDEIKRIVTIARSLSAEDFDEDKAHADAAAIVEFEKHLVAISDVQELRPDDQTISTLQKWTDDVATPNSQVSWSRVFRKLFNGTDIIIQDNETVLLPSSPYQFVHRLVRLLNVTNRRVVANYMFLKLHDKVRELNSMKGDWKKCLEEVNWGLSWAVGAAYARQHLDLDTRSEVSTMIDQLQRAFSSLLDETRWLDEQTRSKLKDKVASMQRGIGYPDWIMNNTALEKYYEGLTFNTTSRTSNSRRLKSLRNRKAHHHTRYAIEMLWEDKTPPTKMNAFYNLNHNTIMFPAAVLRLYGKQFAAANYGGIGTLMAHEMNHGFDDDGRTKDKNNEHLDWPAQASAEYDRRISCLTDQYSHYYPPELTDKNLHVNDAKNKENLADNAGLQVAYRAYRDSVGSEEESTLLPGLRNFTADQIFYLSFANNFCDSGSREFLAKLINSKEDHRPAKFRVIGSLSSLPDFGRHFECREGDRMNPALDNKCIIWGRTDIENDD